MADNSLKLKALLEGAEVIDLSHELFNGMPQSPSHVPYRLLLEQRHGDTLRDEGISFSNEVFITSGHIGTHVDAIGHVSRDGVLYPAAAAAEQQTFSGLTSQGIETFQRFVGRAVLLDVARLHGVDVLPPAYEVTADDLDQACAAVGVLPEEGDAILIATGWSRLWRDKEAFVGVRDGVPGPGAGAGRWLAERRPWIVGAETIAFEQILPGKGHASLPVHGIMLVDHGINIVETMNLRAVAKRQMTEFLLVLNPIPARGATGAPVRPLAISWGRP
jgi:kynurenine formamidase